MRLYLENEWTGDGDCNPLEYWKLKAKCFKRLGVLAKYILCATATTAGVERIFTVAGMVLSAACEPLILILKRDWFVDQMVTFCTRLMLP